MLPIRVSETLLQSERLKQAIGLQYEVALDEPLAKLDQLGTATNGSRNLNSDTHVQEIYTEEKEAITTSWILQAKRRRRCSAPHVTEELRRI